MILGSSEKEGWCGRQCKTQEGAGKGGRSPCCSDYGQGDLAESRKRYEKLWKLASAEFAKIPEKLQQSARTDEASPVKSTVIAELEEKEGD